MPGSVTFTSLIPKAIEIVQEAKLSVPLAGATATIEEAKREMLETKSGVQYPNLPNVSAAPYQGERDQLHGVIDSLQVDDSHAAEGIVDAVGGDGSNVLKWQEYGTNRMPPHPIMTQASYKGEEAVGVALAETAAKLNALEI